MRQIADWLEKLGMSEYAACFAENGIDIPVLRDLTDQDLENIGVLLGHRRKMSGARLGSLQAPSITPTQPSLTGVETPRHRRAPPSHRDVLGPRRFDSALGAHGP